MIKDAHNRVGKRVFFSTVLRFVPISQRTRRALYIRQSKLTNDEA